MEKEVLKNLALDELTEILETDLTSNTSFVLLGLGQITKEYATKVDKVDPYIAKLAGGDTSAVKRKECKRVELDISPPEGSTHYLLGKTVSIEEHYHSTGKSYSYDKIPIAFLKSTK